MANINCNGIIKTKNLEISEEIKVKGKDIITIIDKKNNGTSGYFILQLGELKYLSCWGFISQSFNDNTQYNFTLPDNLNFNNTNWHLSISANGYTDCAWLNSGVSTGNSFYLNSQRYSNKANTLNVKWKASGFIS